MRRLAPVLLLLAIAAGVAVLALTTSAQLGGETPCDEACREQHSLCVSACGEHPDPVECEARCDDERDDCQEQCPPG